MVDIRVSLGVPTDDAIPYTCDALDTLFLLVILYGYIIHRDTLYRLFLIAFYW